MIIGVGIDVVPVERFAESLTRTPGLRDRLFTADEQRTPWGNPRTGESLAARFAAKEAVAKALGAPGDLHWHDAEVTVGEHGRPHLEVRGTVAGRAAQLGVTSWHVSLSHDGGIASAVVVAEGCGRGPVIGLSTTAEVRTAEEPLLASLPEGALMQRAATGLATVCLRLLGPSTDAGSRSWSARATTGATRSSPGPGSPGAAPG